MTTLKTMSQTTVDKHADAIAANIEIDSVIREALDSYFSGFEFADPDNEQEIDSSVRYALINKLKGRF